MKYKVGDRVQIRYDLNAGDVFGAYFINEKMVGIFCREIT